MIRGTAKNVLVLLSLVGCGPSYDLDFDASQCSEEQLVAFQDAGDQWCDATAGACCPNVAFSTGLQPIRLVEVVTDHAGKPKPDSVGITNFYPASGRIEIQLQRGFTGIMPRILRHEFGHVCRKIEHPWEENQPHLDSGNVMALTDPEQPERITDSDRAYVR